MLGQLSLQGKQWLRARKWLAGILCCFPPVPSPNPFSHAIPIIMSALPWSNVLFWRQGCRHRDGGKDEWYLNRQDSLGNYTLSFGRPHSDIAPVDCKLWCTVRRKLNSRCRDISLSPGPHLYKLFISCLFYPNLCPRPPSSSQSERRWGHPRKLSPNLPQVSQEENRENTKERRAVMNASPTHWKSHPLLHLVLPECHLFLQWREVVILKT